MLTTYVLVPAIVFCCTFPVAQQRPTPSRKCRHHYFILFFLHSNKDRLFCQGLPLKQKKKKKTWSPSSVIRSCGFMEQRQSEKSVGFYCTSGSRCFHHGAFRAVEWNETPNNFSDSCLTDWQVQELPCQTWTVCFFWFQWKLTRSDKRTESKAM